MMQLGMFGGVTPPPPTPPAPQQPINISEGGSGRKYNSEEQYLLEQERRHRILEEDTRLIEILKIWMKCQ